MTSSADAAAAHRAAAAGAVVDLAPVHARLPPRAAADRGRVQPVAASPPSPTRCSPTGSSCSATARCAATGAWCASPCWRSGLSATATWFLVTVSTRVQRRFRDKVTIALESHVATLAGVDLDDRASRASRVPRPPVGAAQPGVHARPHVHVAVLDLWLDPSPRRHGGAARVDPSGAGAAGALRAAAGVHLVVAAGRGAPRPGTRCRGQPPVAPPVRRGDHASPGKDVRLTGIAELLVRGGGRRGSRARRRLRRRAGHRRRGTRRRGRSSAPATSARSSSSPRGRRAAGDVLLDAGRRVAAVVLRRRRGRRNRLPARRLDGLGAAAGLARGLRRGGRRHRRPAGADAARPAACASITCRSPIPAPTGSCSTTCRSTCRRARSWRSSARTAPARPRW